MSGSLRDDDVMTPVMLAERFGHPGCLGALLACRPPETDCLDRVNENGRRAGHHAAMRPLVNECLEMVLQASPSELQAP